MSDGDIRPAHYGGKDDPYEVWKIIDAKGLDFYGGNVLKYLLRAGKKPGAETVKDLIKARTYLNKMIASERSLNQERRVAEERRLYEDGASQES